MKKKIKLQEKRHKKQSELLYIHQISAYVHTHVYTSI